MTDAAPSYSPWKQKEVVATEFIAYMSSSSSADEEEEAAAWDASGDFEESDRRDLNLKIKQCHCGGTGGPNCQRYWHTALDRRINVPIVRRGKGGRLMYDKYSYLMADWVNIPYTVARQERVEQFEVEQRERMRWLQDHDKWKVKECPRYGYHNPARCHFYHRGTGDMNLAAITRRETRREERKAAIALAEEERRDHNETVEMLMDRVETAGKQEKVWAPMPTKASTLSEWTVVAKKRGRGKKL